MKVFLKDNDTKKQYVIKGISAKQYKKGEYDEAQLFETIYQLLMKHAIDDGVLIDKNGVRL